MLAALWGKAAAYNYVLVKQRACRQFNTNCICDLICQKGSYTCTVLRHTFCHHLLATSKHQQQMCLIMLKVEQSAFTQASLSSLFGIHECLDSL